MVPSALPRIYRVTDPLLEAIVFHGLAGVDPAPALSGDWEPILETIVLQRLAGAALDLVTTFDVALPERVRRTLTAARYHERCFTLLAELSAATITGVLRRADVPFVVVKGPSIAALDPVPGARPFIDADLLVAPGRFEDAMSAASSAGFGYDSDRPARAYYERLCYEGVNLVDADGRSIDIHHHVPPWWAGRELTYDRVAHDARIARIGGEDVPLASATSNLFIAALHLVSDRNLPGHKLLSWRDVMLTCTLVDPSHVATAARDTGLGWWLHWVLGQMPQTPNIISLTQALADSCNVRAPRVSAARVKALSASGETGLNLAFAARLPIPNAAAYLGGQLVPSKQSRSAHLEGDESMLAWWRHVLRSARSARPAATLVREESSGPLPLKPSSVGAPNNDSASQELTRHALLHTEVDLISMDDLTDRTIALTKARRRSVVANHNLHSIALSSGDAKMRAFYEASDLRFIDGTGVIALSRFLGVPAGRQHRTTYVDWIWPLLEAAERAGIRIAYIGSTDAANESARRAIAARFPRLSFETHHGFFDVEADSPAIVRWINCADPDLLMVGMGMPRQEHWVIDHLASLPNCPILTCGACFEYIAGVQRTPPRWMGRMGLEWLARLVMDPRRLWKRYLVEPLSLIRPVALAKVRGRDKRPSAAGTSKVVAK